MNALTKALLIAILTAGLSSGALARSTDEAFDAAQPKSHGPQTLAGLAQNDVTGVLE